MNFTSKQYRIMAAAVAALLLVSLVVLLLTGNNKKQTAGGTHEFTTEKPDYNGNYYKLITTYKNGAFTGMTFQVYIKGEEGQLTLSPDTNANGRAKQIVDTFLKVQDINKLGDPAGDSNMVNQFAAALEQIKTKLNEQ